LIDGDIGEAVDLLRTAVTEEGGAAEAWNDLAVAYLARGARTGATQDLNDALSACDHALALRPDMPEALFNRALALERLRPSEAVPAWEKALRLDGTPWRAEIEQRLRLARRTP
jgi:tetratricopeptide (TPR) repeat protein